MTQIRQRGMAWCAVCWLVTAAAWTQETAPASAARDQPPQISPGPFAVPRQLLRLFDISDSDLRSLRDGQPFGPDDQEALLKILYRLPQIGADEIHRWQRAEVPWSTLRSEPDKARTEFFVLRGRVRKIARQTLSARQATLMEFDHYYQLDVALEAGAGDAVLYARTIPQAWQNRTELDEPTSTPAMFLKVGPPQGAASSLLFAASRVSWLPDRANAELGIGAEQLWLSARGMDSGLWDDVRTRNRLPLGADERDCFYALLSAVGRAAPAAWAEHARPLPLATLLQHPEQVQGSTFQVTGRVRRITRVVVDEPDIRARYGLDMYYQLDVMVHVGDQPIEIRDARGQQGGPVYRESFPVTCCTLRLPDAWQSLVDAPKVNRPVMMQGVFYKLWAYSNALVESYDADQRQLSPMFIVGAPRAWDPPSRSSFGPGLWVALGVGGLVAALGSVVWLWNRSDRQRVTRKSLPPLDLD